jgi:hypothetical protein
VISPAVPLVDLELQYYSFALSCFVGKLWWICPSCHFSSLGTVSTVRCLACLYWAFHFTHFLLTQLHVLITLWFCAASIIRTTVGSVISPAVPLVDLELQFYSFNLSCFVGKLWWIGPPCHFSSLGTVSIMRCSTCLYWAFCFTHFLSTQLRILITLLFLIFNFCCSTKILSTNLPPLYYHSFRYIWFEPVQGR